MSFVMPVAERDQEHNKFRIEIPREKLFGIFSRRPKVYVLPVIQHLPLDLIGPLKETAEQAARDGLTEARALAVWEQWLRIFDHYLPGQRGRLTDDQLMVALREYQKHSSLAVGESSASRAS